MIFDWDDANILHLARHNIAPDEAEQIINNDPVDIDVQHAGNEWRLQQVGETDSGRILTVISTERLNNIRVVSGWDSPARDRNVYLRYKANQTWKPH